MNLVLSLILSVLIAAVLQKYHLWSITAVWCTFLLILLILAFLWILLIMLIAGKFYWLACLLFTASIVVYCTWNEVLDRVFLKHGEV